VKNSPPRLALRFFRWFCRRDVAVYIEGDLVELFHERVSSAGPRVAGIRFIVDVLLLFRPSMIQSMEGVNRLNNYGMIKSYFRIGWRNMLRNKGYSTINIGGLAAGLAVVMLIGLWIYDEISFNKYHSNYDRIARVWVNHNFNGEISSQWSLPYPLAGELRTQFSDFEDVSVASWSYNHFINHGEDRFSKEGMFVEPEFIQLLSLKMIRGSTDALKDPHAIILTQSFAKVIFGDEDPVGKDLTIDIANVVTVTGVYEDLPRNSYFSTQQWFGNISLYTTDYVRNPRMLTYWGDFSYQAFVSLRDGVSFDESTERIRDVIIKHNQGHDDSKPMLFLQPMSRWHLYSKYENGVNTGGDITFVWLFGVIGVFVLLLACINFMNLSTARSESRSKEIALRKTIGSYRTQLILQFLIESMLVVAIAFAIALTVVVLSLDAFNSWTGKDIHMPFGNPVFWLIGISFILITAIVGGSYPAFLLSSFNTVSILKGTLRPGWFSGFSRKSLVVFQFVVSVTLVVGTATVYQQIEYTRNRPIGYEKDGLITTYGYPFAESSLSPNIYDALREELLNTGAVVNMGKSSSPTTGTYSFQSDFDWDGRDPQLMPNFGVVWCTHDYGKTIGMQIINGRDFSREFASDTASMIINEAAVDYMGLKDPVGQIVRFNRRPFTVIGVMRNMLTDSPYEPVGPMAYMIDYHNANIITMKLNPNQGVTDNMTAITAVFQKFRPGMTFEAQFTDKQFEQKFNAEARIGGLAAAFTLFAILISCLGLFGLASFMAQQRTREIGIRKVSGASVFNLWSLLSRDFIVLVTIASVIAAPLAWMFMDLWLTQFQYRMPLSAWILVAAGLGAIALTLITVSYQSIRAATANPVDSLRSE
jgi:putative ABC transport system permease protein